VNPCHPTSVKFCAVARKNLNLAVEELGGREATTKAGAVGKGALQSRKNKGGKSGHHGKKCVRSNAINGKIF